MLRGGLDDALLLDGHGVEGRGDGREFCLELVDLCLEGLVLRRERLVRSLVGRGGLGRRRR